MELLIVRLRQGFKPSTPRIAWGPGFAAIFLAAVVVFSNAQPSKASQQGSPATGAKTVNKAAVPAKAKQPKRGTWRVRVISDAPIPSISVRAKNAPMVEVIAELQQQMNIPIILTPLIKKQVLTVDFASFPLEPALQLLAPHAVIDYVISGGSRGPSEKKPLAIYLTAANEEPGPSAPFLENQSGSKLLVGMVYATEQEEKEALEKRKNDLQVSFEYNRLKVKVNQQYLIDVLQEIADKVNIPFAILTTDPTQKEVDEVVDLDVKDTSLEDLIMTWFPEAIRLYYRADLQASVSRPLRITLEPPSKAEAQTQAH